MRRPPLVTSLVLACLLAVGVLSLGDSALISPRALAVDPADGASARLLTWWAAHASVGHLLTNAVVLAWVAPSLERHVGGRRIVLTLVLGAAGGLLLHAAVHGGGRPVLGASAVIAALVAHSLVVGWHCPFENRNGRAVLWPGALFHLLVLTEAVRLLAELATGAAASGAATHLGGALGGVLACGLLHGRWPARPAARRATRTRALVAADAA